MRRRHTESHENHERWLVSYADFITLLFAFFVVMFASTQSDKNKAREVSESVRQALEQGQFSAAISVVLGRGPHESRQAPPPKGDPSKSPQNAAPPQHPADLRESLNTLQKGLAAELDAGKVQLHLEARGLIISLREAAFFASGDDQVAPSSISTVGKIAAVIHDLPQPLRLEGYTDSIPIHTPRFRSNWELSSARAIAMLELLHGHFQIPYDRMAVAGYAENFPADTNDSEEGRSHNRRVDLVVLSAEALRAEPGR